MITRFKLINNESSFNDEQNTQILGKYTKIILYYLENKKSTSAETHSKIQTNGHAHTHTRTQIGRQARNNNNNIL